MLYKNWPVICRITRRHPSFLPAFMAVNTAGSNREVEQRFIDAFPECFSEKPITESVPLSLLLQEDMTLREGQRDRYGIASYEVFNKHSIPFLVFCLQNGNVIERWKSTEGAPLSFAAAESALHDGFGKRTRYEGGEFFCAYAGGIEPEKRIVFVPSECIAIDL